MVVWFHLGTIKCCQGLCIYSVLIQLQFQVFPHLVDNELQAIPLSPCTVPYS